MGRRQRIAERKAARIEAEARSPPRDIVDEAKARSRKKLKTPPKHEYRQRRSELQRQENRLTQKIDSLDHKLENLDHRDRNLNNREKEIETHARQRHRNHTTNNSKNWKKSPNLSSCRCQENPSGKYGSRDERGNGRRIREWEAHPCSSRPMKNPRKSWHKLSSAPLPKSSPKLPFRWFRFLMMK